MSKPLLTLHHTTESDGLVTAHFNVPGYKHSLCALIVGRPHNKPKIRIRMIPEAHPILGPYWSWTNVEDVPAAKKKNITWLLTQIGR